MKKVFKYRVFTMVILIVLIFSGVPAYAKVDPPADNVAGIGTSNNPYVIDMSSSSSKRIVVEPETVPFYFVVKGVEGVGGVFVIDYDITTGLVSFLLDRSVYDSADERYASVYVTESEYNTRRQQLGVKYRVVEKEKTSFPTYDIQEILQYNTSKNNASIEGGSEVKKENRKEVTRNLNLSNLSLQASYTDMARGDIYFLANRIEGTADIDKLFASSGYSKTASDNNDSTYTKENFQTVYIGNESIEENNTNFSIMYRFGGKTNSALDDSAVGEDVTVEGVIARLLISIGDTFLLKMLIQGLFGKELTINSLIFNTYDGTKLEFYSKSSNAITQSITNVVNYWYNVFSALAYILYVIILVYIGVMLIISAGTPNCDKMKRSLGDWVAGLVILLAVPAFVIPSLIKLNDAFVKFMYNKNDEEVVSYYSLYEISDDIIGGDSSTLSIEELMNMRNEESDKLDELNKNREKLLDDYIQKMLDEAGSGPMADTRREETIRNMFETIITRMRSYLSGGAAASRYSSLEECIERITQESYEMVVANMPDNRFREVLEQYCVPGASQFETTVTLLKEIASAEQKIDTIDKLIEVKQSDLMTVMRAYAGKYQRLVFVAVWYSLLFQLIALIFIYYKRIFVIALLITVFPLIMVFYCIDKMADGSAQTLSMWFNELLSNIFIQSIHCIMYTVLVQMGLEIYKADPSNWFLFLAAMLLIVPAEKILREIFGLGGSTLGKLGGMGMKAVMATGAIVKLAGKGIQKTGDMIKGRQDKAFVDKMNKNFGKIQRSQNRADAKATIRANKRQINGQTELSKWGKFREGAYHAATKVREFEAKAAPKVAKAARTAKNAAATGTGVVYGVAAGGGLDGLTQGMSFAEELKGKKGKMVSGNKAIIKDELAYAYKRKAEKNAKK